MVFGLQWVRRRQRSLAKGVVALFCLAWLQVAALPCVMAHDGVASPVTAASHVGHGGAPQGMPASPPGTPGEHCPYCPPGTQATPDCSEHGGCAYPHGPQVDARLATSLFVPLVGTVSVRTVHVRTLDRTGETVEPLRLPSRVPLSVSYCRFIE